MRLFAWLVLLCASAVAGMAQDSVGTSTVTLGVGGAGPYDGGPVLKANYEYRWTRHLAVEAGTDITFVPTTNYQLISIASIQPGVITATFTSTNQYFFLPASGRKVPVMIPFGVKGFLPMRNGRVELFGGLGAVYTFNALYNTQHHWMAQLSAGARVSLDHERRFWLGTTWRGFNNFQGSYPAGRNDFSGTADFGFRFGH